MSYAGMTVHVPDEVLVQQLPDGETVILHMGTEQYFGLNESASSMWDALSSNSHVDEALTALVAGYDVEPETLERDLEQFLDELTGRGLIQLG